MKEPKTNFNAQTYIDVRMVAAFHLWCVEQGVIVRPVVSELLRKVLEASCRANCSHTFESATAAVEYLEQNGFELSQLKINYNKRGLVKELTSESLSLEDTPKSEEETKIVHDVAETLRKMGMK